MTTETIRYRRRRGNTIYLDTDTGNVRVIDGPLPTFEFDYNAPRAQRGATFTVDHTLRLLRAERDENGRLHYVNATRAEGELIDRIIAIVNDKA
ncbi:hypothetical protein ACTXN7_11645 [Corynebacterium flavescens]|uniref:hypothetical protein n=1 Tax=Corynebacterium flavescens TaxID=28028 RepID=UPI003FD47ACB